MQGLFQHLGVQNDKLGIRKLEGHTLCTRFLLLFLRECLDSRGKVVAGVEKSF